MEGPESSMSIQRSGGKVIPRVAGRRDSQTTPLFTQFLEDEVEGQGHLDIVIDLTDVPAVDPGTIGAVASSPTT